MLLLLRKSSLTSLFKEVRVFKVGDPHGDPQTSPEYADPHGFLAWLSAKRHQVHVDRRVVGWSAGRHADHACGWQISPWIARKVTDFGLMLEVLEK